MAKMLDFIILITSMLEIFAYQFMVRALLAGFFISAVLGFLGSFVVVRRMSFMGEGIAHSSLAGIALALLLGWAPLPTAVMFAIIVAVGIYFLERKVNISSDMAIGIMFTTGMALGVVLISFYSGYQPELLSYLFGNILTVNNSDLFTIVVASIIIFLFLSIFHRQLVFTTFDHDGAYLSGIDSWKYDLFLYVATAVAIVLSIKLVGIILVSALLIIPGAFSLVFAKSFRSFCQIAILFAILMTVLGLIVSYYLDLPSGATIVLTGAAIFIAGYLFKD